jgi:hypothetical protein
MSYKKIFLIIVCGLALLLPKIGSSQSQKEVSAKISDGKIVTEREPEEDFQKARESFLKEEVKASAAAIRRGAAYFMKLQEQVEEKREQTFSASQKGLSELADKVEKGAVKSVRELDDVFSRASSALAQYYYQMANESWARKEASKAGHELRAAAFHLEKGIQRTEGKVESSVQSLVQKTGRLSEKMIKGVKVAEGEVEKGIQNLGKKIEKLGKMVKKGGQ